MGGSSKTKTSSTSTYTPNSTAMSAYESLFPIAQQVASTDWNPQTAKQVAGFSPQQTAAFDQIGSLQGQYVPFLNTASNLTAQASAPISASAIENYSNPYQQQVIDATMAQLNQQNAVAGNNLKGNQIAQGAFGGSRAKIAQAALAGQQGLNTASTLSSLNAQNYNQALSAAQTDANRQLQAGSQFANLGQMGQTLGLQGAGALYGAGQSQQQQLQSQYDAATSNASAQTQWPFATSQWLSGIYGSIGPLMGGTTTGSSTSSTSQGMGAGQYAGMALSAMALMSDKRAKRDIEKVGELFDGQPIYRYQYKDKPGFHIGLIAQDVEKEHPEAIAEMGGGLKGVEYHAATEDAADRGHFASGGSVIGNNDAFWSSLLQPVRTAQPIVPSLPSGGGGGGNQTDQVAEMKKLYELGKSARKGLDKLSENGDGTSLHESDHLNSWSIDPSFDSTSPNAGLFGTESWGSNGGLFGGFFADGGSVIDSGANSFWTALLQPVHTASPVIPQAQSSAPGQVANQETDLRKSYELGRQAHDNLASYMNSGSSASTAASTGKGGGKGSGGFGLFADGGRVGYAEGGPIQAPQFAAIPASGGSSSFSAAPASYYAPGQAAMSAVLASDRGKSAVPSSGGGGKGGGKGSSGFGLFADGGRVGYADGGEAFVFNPYYNNQDLGYVDAQIPFGSMANTADPIPVNSNDPHSYMVSPVAGREINMDAARYAPTPQNAATGVIPGPVDIDMRDWFNKGPKPYEIMVGDRPDGVPVYQADAIQQPVSGFVPESTQRGFTGLANLYPGTSADTTPYWNKTGLSQIGGYVPELSAYLDTRQGKFEAPETVMLGDDVSGIAPMTPQPGFNTTIAPSPVVEAIRANPTDKAPLSVYSVTGKLETGQSDPYKGVHAITRDTNNSYSYGNFQLNSQRGASMWQFKKEYGEQFGLTATPGTPEFRSQWAEAARRDPTALIASEQEFHNKHVLEPMRSRLEQNGLTPEVAADPRVTAYISDHMVQHGYGQSSRNDPRFATAWENSDKTAEGFLKQMHEYDRRNIPSDFRTYLRQQGNMRGLQNRVDNRYKLSMQVGTTPTVMSGASESQPTAQTNASDAQPNAQPTQTPTQSAGFAPQASPQTAETPSNAPAVAPAVKAAVTKGFAPTGSVPQTGYKDPQDQKTGGLLQRVLGVDFNPLNLTDRERQGLLMVGLNMAGTPGGGNPFAGAAQGYGNWISMQHSDRDAAFKAQQLALQAKHFGPIGVNAMGQQQYGTVDLMTGQVTPVGGSGVPSLGGIPSGSGAQTSQLKVDSVGIPLRSEGMSPSEYIEALPEPYAGRVKAIISGKEPLPTSMKSDPMTMSLRAMVERADPTFTANRYEYRKAFLDPNKQTQKTLTALGTAIHHGGTVDDAVSNLGDYGFSPANAASNSVKRMFGSTSLRSFEDTASAYADEVSKVFSGGIGTAAERQAAEARVSSSLPTRAIRSGNAANIELLLGRTKKYNDEWTKNLGPNVEPPELFSDEERQIIRKIFANEPDEKVKAQRYERLRKDPQTADLVAPLPERPHGRAETKAPSVGTIIEGSGGKRYRYLGGDQTSASSYELVQ